MAYLEDFKAELKHKLERGEDVDAVAKWVAEKILESYRNGLAAGGKGKSSDGRTGGKR